MKGIVFNLLEELVVKEMGVETWEKLLQASGSQGIYTSLGDYPDAELGAFVGVAAKALGKSEGDIVRWFGRGVMPFFVARYPAFFTPHKGTRSFVMTLNGIIHPEVRKLYPGAHVPEFDFHEHKSGALVMGYRSKKKMCAFAEGLIHGAADHYGEEATIDRPKCMLRGDPKCELILSFRRR